MKIKYKERSNVELPLEHCEEYDAIAKWCAKRGVKGEIGDNLPDLLSANGALKFIQCDPESFQRRVKEIAYGLSMEHAEQYR